MIIFYTILILTFFAYAITYLTTEKITRRREQQYRDRKAGRRLRAVHRARSEEYQKFLDNSILMW